MRRVLPLLPVAFLLALASVGSSTFGCATYRQDLERARGHYDKNEFEPALALFRVLEPDLDSLSTGEQAQYAYSRGMTDYRLASLSTAAPTATVVDPKQGYRSNARHWLSVAAAIEKQTPGGLSAEEKTRLQETLDELNREVYGESTDADAGAPAPAAPGKSDKK